jgi:hypothetical protein
MTSLNSVGPDVDLDEHLSAPVATARVRTRPPEPDRSSPPAGPPSEPFHVRWLTLSAVLLLIVVALGPLVVLAIKAGASEWFPGGDRAVIELHVRDVGSHTPLVGPYSRYGWSHPGPLLYWVLAVPYRLLGATSSALLAGVVILDISAIAGTLAIAWRRGRLPLLTLTALFAALLVRYLPPTTLDDPWNPFVTVLPVLLFVAVCWTCREGDRWAAPLVVLVGSFLVQSHVGYLGIVGVATAWVVVGSIRRQWARGDDASTRPRRLLRAIRPGPTVAACALAVALCWAPVVVDEIHGSHNLTQLASYFSSDPSSNAGTGYAAGVVSRQLVGLPLGDQKTRPPWLGGDEPNDATGGEEPVNAIWLAAGAGLFLLLGLGARRVARRSSSSPEVRDRAWAAVHFQTLTALCGVAGIVSVARINDTVFDYLIRWWSSLAMVLWLAAGWSAWVVFSDWRARHQSMRVHRAVRVAAFSAAMAVMVFVGFGFVIKTNDTVTPEDYNREQLAALSGPTVAATPLGGPVLVVDDGGGVAMIGDGLRLQLERADRPIVVRPDSAYKFGSTRDASIVKPVAVVHVVYGDAIVDASRRSDLHQVALWDPLSPTDRAEYFQDVVVLRNQFLAAHRTDLFDNLYSGDSLFAGFGLKGIDQDLLKRVEAARAAGRPVAVFIGPPTSASLS